VRGEDATEAAASSQFPCLAAESFLYSIANVFTQQTFAPLIRYTRYWIHCGSKERLCHAFAPIKMSAPTGCPPKTDSFL
jgi:hypothetical protein